MQAPEERQGQAAEQRGIDSNPLTLSIRIVNREYGVKSCPPVKSGPSSFVVANEYASCDEGRSNGGDYMDGPVPAVKVAYSTTPDISSLLRDLTPVAIPVSFFERKHVSFEMMMMYITVQ